MEVAYEDPRFEAFLHNERELKRAYGTNVVARREPL